MQVEEKGNNIVITIPKNAKPLLTPSQKSFMVASSHGNTPTALLVNGQPVIVGVNCFIKNLKYVKPTS